MIRKFAEGNQVAVTCPGEPRFGQHGIVVRGEYPGMLTRRPMVDVLFDGDDLDMDEGVYVQNLELQHSLKVIA